MGLTATAGLPEYHTIFAPGFFAPEKGVSNSCVLDPWPAVAEIIAGWLESGAAFPLRVGRSCYGRFLLPDISNPKVLEIVNPGHTPLALYPRTKYVYRIGKISGAGLLIRRNLDKS